MLDEAYGLFSAACSNRKSPYLDSLSVGKVPGLFPPCFNALNLQMHHEMFGNFFDVKGVQEKADRFVLEIRNAIGVGRQDTSQTMVEFL